MLVRPVLRRIASVAAVSSLLLAAGPLAGTAAAAPVVASLSPADGASVQPPATVTACFTDTLIVLSTITVTSESVPVPGTSGLTACGGTNRGVQFTPTPALEEGTYDVSATVRDDLMDPMSTTTVTWSFDVDTTDPTTPTALTITNPVTSANVTNVTVSGTTSPLTDVAVAIKNTPTPGATAVGTGTSNGAGAFSITGIDASALSDGAISATVTATDEAGNDAAASVASVKDATAPVRTSTTPANGGTSQTRTTVVVTFNESLDTAASDLLVKNGSNNTLGGPDPVFSTVNLANDTMTFTASSNITPAGNTYTVTAIAQDLAGNSGQTVSTFTIDETDPVAPSVNLTDPINIANVATAVVSGVAEPGSTVNVSVDDTTVGSPVTGSGPAHATTGAYSVPVDLTALNDGEVVATATATDPAGNVGPAGTSAASDKDTAPPAAPTVTLADPVNSGNQAVAAVSGVAEPGSTVNISVDDTVPGSPVTKTTPADGTTGAYSTTIDLTPLGDGTVTATVTATDAAGNTGASDTDTATKDAGLPAQPTLSVPTVNDANKTAVPASGVAEPGSSVEVTLSDGVQTLTETDTADGTTGEYAVSFGAAGLADGPLTATATATDAAGNDSPVRTVNLTKDTLVPGTPTIVMPAFVNDATKAAVELSGTAEAASTVDLVFSDTDGGTSNVVTSVVTAPNGSWTKTVDLTSLTDGTITGTATATDAAGNVSSPAQDTSDKDVVKPASPVVTLTNPINPGNVATSAVAGTAEAGSLVNVTVVDSDGATGPVTGSGTATGGNYSVPVDLTSLSDGAITASATATDAAGNVSDAGQSASSVKDTTTLDVVTFTPAHNSTVKPPTTVTVVLNEPVDPAQTTLTVADASTSTLAGATTFTNGNKTVVFTPTDTLSDAGSPYSAVLTAKDADGSDSLAAGSTFTVDGTPPATPSVTMPPAVNAATDDSVAVSGIAEPGSTVSISVDDATIGSPATTTTPAHATTGAYSVNLDLSGLDDGVLTATVKAIDVATNESPAATATTNKDATLPGTPTVSMPEYVNNAIKAAVEISGVAEPGSDVVVSVDDATPGDPVVEAVEADGTTGDYLATMDLTSLGEGLVTATVVATDAAGNPSAPGTDTATKDTGVPAAPSVTLSEPINAANKTTVTVSGVAEPGTAVAVSVDDATVGDPLTQNTTADGTTGEYTTTFDVTSLADGTLTATVKATDAAGNVSANGTDTAQKDSGLPAVPTLDVPATVTHATYTAAPFSGTAEAGSTVTVSVDDSDSGTAPVSGSTTADGGGLWTKSLDLSSLDDGTLSVNVTSADPSGNPASAGASGTVLKNVTRAFTFSLGAAPVSGAAQEFTVSARQTYLADSPVDTTFTGTPVLSSLDTHFTAGTCGAAVAGVASCSGTVFGDLGDQVLTATHGSGNDLVTATRAVDVQPISLAFSVAPPATATLNQSLPFTVIPVAGVAGAVIDGYDATRTLVTTGTSQPATGTVLTCPSATCSSTVSFPTRGPKTVKVTDNGTPSLSTPTISVVIPYATSLSLTRSTLTQKSGGFITISGKLTNTTLVTGVGSKTIKIYRKTAPNTTFKLYTTTTTKADGTWAKRMQIVRNTAYKAVFVADTSYLGATSPERTIKASQVVSVAWSTSGRTVKAAGRVSPNAAGRTIYLQYRKSDGTWGYAGAKAIVGSTGGYTMSRTFAAGRYVLRTAIAATSVNTAGYSVPLSVRLV